MLDKIAKKQLTQKFKKSWYVGYQAENWKTILSHEFFTESLTEMKYDWIVSKAEREQYSNDDEKLNEVFEETIQKVFNIFCARSGTLFSDEDVLMWLREIIGFVLTELETGTLSETRDLLIAQL